MKIDQTVINVGNSPQGVPVKGKFILHNLGTDILFIEKIIPDCYCTSYSIEKNFFGPNDSTHIILEYDGLRPGIFQASAVVHFKSGKTGHKEELLVFRGNIEKEK